MNEQMTATTTLQEAVTHYLQSARDKKPDAQAIAHFVRWFGPDRSVRSLQPADIERYGEEASKSSGEAQRRLESVRAFLTFAKKDGMTDTPLALHLRLRRSGTVDTATEGRDADGSRYRLTASPPSRAS